MTALPSKWRYGASKNMRSLGRINIPGGGQVVVRNGFAYVGHMKPPHGTSIIDVHDPKNPRLVAEIAAPAHGMSHKARVRDGILLTNSQKLRGVPDNPDFTPGLRIFDIENPTRPRLVTTCVAAALAFTVSIWMTVTPTWEPSSKVFTDASLLFWTSSTQAGQWRWGAGGFRVNGPPVAKRRHGKRAGTVAIIHCAAEIGSMSAIGMPDS